MLKFVDYDIVFQEVPNEVTLAINLSLCPNNCEGCHSAFLKGDVGEELSTERLDEIIKKYEGDITCVSFMGGDGDVEALARLAAYVKQNFSIKVAWYSGKEKLPEEISLVDFDYIKVGPYKKDYGPLNNKSTNQRMYRMSGGEIVEDVTSLFWK